MDFKTTISMLQKEFEANRIRYALMGGFAFGIWGAARTTVDLDFLVAREDLDKIHRIMEKIGYELKFRTDNVSQYVSPLLLFGQVDLLHAFREASMEMLARAVDKEIFGGKAKIKVLRPEDLVGLKMQAIRNDPSRREQDTLDIKALISVQREFMAWDQIEKYAEILEMTDFLEEIRGE